MQIIQLLGLTLNPISNLIQLEFPFVGQIPINAIVTMPMIIHTTI